MEKIDFVNKKLPNYEVSNYGRIKNFAYKKYPNGKIINSSCVNGYKTLNVRLDNGKTISKYIHKLVAEYFVKKKQTHIKYTLFT